MMDDVKKLKHGVPMDGHPEIAPVPDNGARRRLNWEATSAMPALMWDITNRCNLRCLHCYNFSAPSGQPVRDLPGDLLFDIADQVLEMKPFVVCLCGGEPLMRDEAFAIARKLSAEGIAVNTVSNGFDLDRDKVLRIKDAGFSLVQISLDGATAASHDALRGKGSFDRALRAIHLLKEEKVCEPSVTIIPNMLNYEEVPRWIDLVRELGARTIRSMPLLPIGRAVPYWDKLALSAEAAQQVAWWFRSGENIESDEDLEWGDPMEHIFNFSEWENTMRNAGGEIRSDGALLVSTYLPIVCGNVTRHTLKEYWDAGYKDIWRHPLVKEYAGAIRCIDDFATQPNLPWTRNDVVIELIPD